MFQHDLKGLLAYSTISHLGLITLLLGLNSPLAAVAAVFHIMNHATFKASLFMAAGIIDHESGTRDIRRLSGLRNDAHHRHAGHAWPVRRWRACRCSTASCPRKCSSPRPCSWTRPTGAQALPVVATVAGMFSVAYSLRFTSMCSSAPRPPTCPKPHEPPHWMRVPVELLVLACLVVGMLPAWSVGPFLNAAPARGGRHPAGIQPGRLAWREYAAHHELRGAGGRHCAVHGAALLRKTAALTTPPVLQRINGKRIFDNVLARISLLAKHAPRTDHRRLQWQMLWLVCIACWRLHAAVDSRPGAGQPPAPAAVARLPGAVGDWLPVRLGAAWKAKYHRMAR
jgi:multicomponent K+:H+ antiporter subunit A